LVPCLPLFPPPSRPTLFPYTTLFRSRRPARAAARRRRHLARPRQPPDRPARRTAAGHTGPRGGRSCAPPGDPRRAHRGAERAALMPGSAPTVLATSAGYRPHPRLRFGFGTVMAPSGELAADAEPRPGDPRRL